MRTPRNLAGDELIRRLGRFGYEPTRQSGSHVRLTRRSPDGEHHITVPLHSPLRVGTLNAILSEIAGNLGVSKDDLIRGIS
jgi:predicted RNA binding protein YcfA (HicA-like mRNA interferase family)